MLDSPYSSEDDDVGTANSMADSNQIEDFCNRMSRHEGGAAPPKQAGLGELANTWTGEIEEVRKYLGISKPQLFGLFRSLKLTNMKLNVIEDDCRDLFSSLVSLDISCNHVESLANLSSGLVSLSAYNNEIHDLERLPNCQGLMQLGLGFNFITQVPSSLFLSFPSLISLDLSYNNITSLDPLTTNLRSSSSLRHLSLEGNPCSLLPMYRPRVISELPDLQMLDDVAISSIADDINECLKVSA